jgi:transposase
VRIISTIKEKKEAIIAARATRGRFILATNDLDKTRLPDEQILKEYKDLQKVERGFRFLKDPWFLLDKIFLKTPNRIAALMVYTVAEYELRQRLKRENLTLPNQLKKEVNNPTMRWVFKMMDGITVVTMTAGGVVQTVVANITKLREKIIRLFGKFTQEIYSILPEPELI